MTSARWVVRSGERTETVGLLRRGSAWEVSVGERHYRVDVAEEGSLPRLLSLLVDGAQYELVVAATSGESYGVGVRAEVRELQVQDPLSDLAQSSRSGSGVRGGQTVKAYMPGRVVSLLVAEGDVVEAGQGVLVLEAMKMENEIKSEAAGVLAKIFVTEGQAVEGGDRLFEVAVPEPG